MWIEYISNTTFFKRLFEDIPDLKNVYISKLSIENYNEKIKLSFILSRKIDYLPKKWEEHGFNALYVEIDFYDVSNFSMELDKHEKSNIDIVLCEEKIKVSISGGMKVEFISEASYLQKVEGIND